MASTSSHPQFPAGSATRSPGLRWIHAVPAMAFVLALAASITLLFLPVYTTSSAPGADTDTATLLAHNGTWVLIPLALPVLLTAVIALVRGRAAAVLALVCAVLLAAFAVLSLPSIGMFYLPAALVGLVAGVVRMAARRRVAARDRRR